MNTVNLLKRNKRRAEREAVMIALITLSLIILGLCMHWTETVVYQLYKYQALPVDDILIPLIVTATLTIVYIYRRNKEYKAVITHQIAAKAQFQKAQDQLEMMLHSSPAMLFSSEVGADLNVIYISDNVTRILGYSHEETLESRFWLNNIHPDEVSGILVQIELMYQNGHGKFEYRFKHKDGSWRWLVADVKVLYDANLPMELIGTLWDMTEQKLEKEMMANANKRFELSYKATKNIIFDWDMITNQVWSSDEIFDSFGYKKENEPTAPSFTWWKDHIHHEDVNGVLESITRTLEEKADYWVKEYRFLKGDGSYADIFGNGYVVYLENQQPIRWVGAMTDVTVFKVTEMELRHAKEKAEDSMRAKSEFLANMSHEIRTPLNGIISMTEMTLDTELTDEQNRYLTIVKKSSATLFALINDILDFSKIDAGKLDLSYENYTLREQLPACLQPISFKASEKQIEFVCKVDQNVPDLLITDPLRFEQIITNLSSNALKFTEKGEIVVSVKLKSRSSGKVTLLFSVTDTGIGIPAEKLLVIFEDFKQADGSTTRQYGGTGLGLAISKRLIEMMGGEIWVESKEGSGSTFLFTMEFELQANTKTINPDLMHIDGTRVLVVEDNRNSRETICSMIEHLKMLPTGVNCGEDALLELSKASKTSLPFQLILLDIGLEGKLDGFDVASEIKANPALADTGIIVISMSQKESDRERFHSIGVDNFFTKPFGLSALFDCMQNEISKNDNYLNPKSYTHEN
jgi:two-component system, sensor histidine kinase and response regulator